MNTNEGRFQKGDLETNVGRGVKNKQQGAVMTSLPKFDCLCMDGESNTKTLKARFLYFYCVWTQKPALWT